MSRFEFSLANFNDEEQLRRRMAANRMEGDISVSFRREPNYFAGCDVQGETVEIIKCTDTLTGNIVGLGSRLLYWAFVNGELQKLGYLADLRADPAVRNGTLVARGYRFLRQLHDKNPVKLYISLILSENETALKNLVGGRAGLPQYRDMGGIFSPAIHLDLPKREISLPGVSFCQGKLTMIGEIFAFLNRWRSHKQFSPYYGVEEFGTGRLRGLKPEDFYLAIRDHQIIGVVAAWDQGAFRQTHIEGYSSQMAKMRFFYNLTAQVTPLKALPTVGEKVPYFYLGLVAIQDNQPEIFRALVRQVYCDRYQGEWNYFIAGLHNDDPLVSVLKEYRRISVGGKLFAIHYSDGETDFQQLDGRIPYVEIAAV